MRTAAVAQTGRAPGARDFPQVIATHTQPEPRPFKSGRRLFAVGRFVRGELCDVMEYFDDAAIVREHQKGIIP